MATRGPIHSVMASFLIICGAVLGGAGICAATLLAHVVASVCSSPVQARNWEVAVRSWLVHAIVILVAGVLLLAPQAQAVRGTLAAAGVLFLVGTLLFSGCLAIFAISGRIIFAAIAPLGSITLLVGWGVLVYSGFGIR
jgi:uncharacterized membrane protein YgdD (TMEM256/DUF423 family)